MSFLSTASWFDDEAESARGIIEEFGEWFTLHPFRTMQVNFPAGPDPTRQSFQFRGVFERDAKNLSVGMQEVTVSTRRLCVMALVCDARDAQQGDRMTHALTGETFEIIDHRPDGLSCVELRLSQIGRQTQ